MMRRDIRSEEGSILPLLAASAAFALALILLAVAATSLYLERKRLLTLADGAALVGAEAFDLDDVAVDGSGLVLELDDAAVRAAVEAFLREMPADDFTGLQLDSAESVDGRSATVSLSAQWYPPVLGPLLPEGIRIDVEATARSVFG